MTNNYTKINYFFLIQAIIVTAAVFAGVATDTLNLNTPSFNYVWAAFAYVFVTPFIFCAYYEFKIDDKMQEATETVKSTVARTATQVNMSIDANISKSEEHLVL